jgi:hypothetical protein
VTYVEQLHAVIDRIAEADARRDAALSDRAAAVDELRDLLDEQPGPGRVSDAGASGEGPVAVGDAAAASPAASPGHPCPDCDFEGRTPQGVAVHRRRRHGVVGKWHDPIRPQPQKHPKPATNGMPLHPVNGAHPSRKEKFLCSRCSASFLTRELRDAHQAEANCAPIPTRPPAGPTPLGPLSGPGAGDGFGQ